MSSTTKILYFITEDWFFCSHFLDRAIAAQQAGFDVVVVTNERKHGNRITSNGIKLIPLSIKRTGKNPFRETKTIYKLNQIYKKEAPHIVHHIAVKPILYGTIAAMISGIPYIVNAPVGMGYVFSSSQLMARIFRPFLLAAYRLLMNPINSVVILENPDDQLQLIESGIVNPKRNQLIRGAGVNLEDFSPSDEQVSGVPIVLLASRMLWDKGVGEFVEAASIINKNGVKKARFVLVGDSDPENPAAISNLQLQKWHSDGVVEWWGRQENMPHIFSQSNIFCLPSYREGLPKVLIEAAACSRAIVTTEVPGCREVVQNGENGFWVPIKDSVALADALIRLIDDPKLRKKMGKRGRLLVETEFSNQIVIQKTLDLYRDLLSCREY